MRESGFSLYRVFRFVRMEIMSIARKITVTAIVMALAFIVTNFVLQGLLKVGNVVIMGTYWGILIIGGTVFTANLGESAGLLRTGGFYYTMPVSILEKYLGRFLLTGPLYFAFAHLVLFLMVLISGLLVNGLTPTKTGYFFLPGFQGDQVAGPFFLLHAVFFCGGQLFRKNAFANTAGIILGTILVSTLLFLAAFHSIFSFTDVPHQVESSLAQYLMMFLSPSPYVLANRIFAYALLMPLLWVAGYRLFKERTL